jgi:hypothetical protein
MKDVDRDPVTTSGREKVCVSTVFGSVTPPAVSANGKPEGMTLISVNACLITAARGKRNRVSRVTESW